MSPIGFFARRADEVRKLAVRVERGFNELLSVGCYRLENGWVVRRNGLWSSDKVAVSQIARWWVDHEMAFDIVSIELISGVVVRWLDGFNDLLEILARVAPDRRSEPQRRGV